MKYFNFNNRNNRLKTSYDKLLYFNMSNSRCKFETHSYNGTWEKRKTPVSCGELKCPYIHKEKREKACSKVNSCPFSDCKLLHNTQNLQKICFFKKACKNGFCPFRHPSDRATICAVPKTCSDQNCSMIHSVKACNYGFGCRSKDTCSYRHIDTSLPDPFDEDNTCNYIINGQRCPRIVDENKLCKDHLWMSGRGALMCYKCGENPVHFLIKDEDLCCKCFSSLHPIDWRNIFDEYVYNFPTIKKEHDNLRKKMRIEKNLKIVGKLENTRKLEIFFAFLYFGISHISEYNSSVNKKTFKKLSLVHHPDKNDGNDEAFKSLLYHYEVLRILF